MSGYKREMKETLEFDGDQVTFVFRPMKRKHAAAMSSFSTFKEGDSLSEEQMDALTRVVSDCVIRIDGLTDADGEPVSKDTVLQEAYFMELVAEMINRIAERSALGKSRSGS